MFGLFRSKKSALLIKFNKQHKYMKNKNNWQQHTKVNIKQNHQQQTKCDKKQNKQKKLNGKSKINKNTDKSKQRQYWQYCTNKQTRKLSKIKTKTKQSSKRAEMTN